MKKFNSILLIILVLSLVVGCTPQTTKPEKKEDKDIVNSGDSKPEPMLSKTTPEDFPEDIVPLYAVDRVERGIFAGEDYYQVYYYSNTDPRELYDHYELLFSDDDDIKSHEKINAYEFNGKKNNYNVKLHIISSNEDDFKSTVMVILSGVNSDIK
jgi:hypothetical protein